LRPALPSVKAAGALNAAMLNHLTRSLPEQLDMLTYMSMTRTTVYLDDEAAISLRQLAAVLGRTQAELIRDALSAYTKRAARPAPKGLGKYRSGEPDVAQKAKTILADAARRGGWR